MMTIYGIWREREKKEKDDQVWKMQMYGLTTSFRVARGLFKGIALHKQ